MNNKSSSLSSHSLYMTVLQNEKNGENKADPISKGRSANGEIVGEHEKSSVSSSPNSEHRVTKDHYEEIMDLTEMDYSPARRKPPIHN
ncbi:hypothetical protein NC653_015777 [Populus alba x Populus x berolinensis]|uniref:Uncharacterized protein n=1 Tax=Populus alba x Populus x berolinensis TaxID=444605 RepID=A0AAD6VYK7_9ROSI|nr:hypothetical protein NC653_015777 [Populus alba x Populus x berolinensis]